MLMNRLNDIQDVILYMANKVYIKDTYTLKESFKSTITKSFYSEIEPIDFVKCSDAAQTINTWVENKTNDKIKDLVKPGDFDKETRLVMVNAIYFKGKWKHPFKVEATTSEKFYLNENDTVDVQMMHIKEKFCLKYDQDLNAKVLQLPYTNENVSMIIILPCERNGLVELEKKLSKVDLTMICEGMSRPEVQVSLPKFKMESTIELNEPLSTLGLSCIFEEKADFSGILEKPERLCVSKVVQKAFIEVNEEGAEAAAATEKKLIRVKRGPREFRADHPFIATLAVRDDSLTSILFIGRICNPNS